MSTINKLSLIVKIIATFFIIACQVTYAQDIGQINYSATCQDVGDNSSGENILTNCSSGILTATGCSSTTNSGDLHVSCNGSNYVFVCGNGNYNGYWYTITSSKYKCIN